MKDVKRESSNIGPTTEVQTQPEEDKYRVEEVRNKIKENELRTDEVTTPENMSKSKRHR